MYLLQKALHDIEVGNEIDKAEGDVAVVGNKILFTRHLKAGYNIL